jgi:hypothetical protein
MLIFLPFTSKLEPRNSFIKTASYANSERGRYPIWQSLDHPNFLPGSRVTVCDPSRHFCWPVKDDLEFDIEWFFVKSRDSFRRRMKNEVTSVVRSMYQNIAIPEPSTDFFFPRWHSNPLFRGSYSNWLPSFYIEHLDNWGRTLVGFTLLEKPQAENISAGFILLQGERYI